MKSRRLTFFVDPAQVGEVISAIESDVLPRYSVLAHFLGFIALKSELGPRSEIVVITLWDGALEETEPLFEVFRDQVQRATGMMPAREAFDILRVMVRDANGEICLDSP